MANKNIKEVESGELTALFGSEGIETDDGAASNWVQAINLHQMLQGVGLVNGRISPTVASNNLTLAVKHRDGSDPSASKPVGIYLAGSLRIVSAPLSVSAPAGTNYCNLGGNETKTIETDLFAYLSWRTLTSAVVIGFSRYPGANLYSDFNATSTNDKGAPFNATPASTDEVTVIGRFAATLSGGAGFTWSVPAYTASNLVPRPIYETRLLTWAPQHSRSGGAYTNLPAVGLANYIISGRLVHVNEQHTQNAVPGSSGYQIFTLPFTAANGKPLFGENLTSLTGFQAYVFGIAGAKTISLFRYDGTQECTASNLYGAQGYYDI